MSFSPEPIPGDTVDNETPHGAEPISRAPTYSIHHIGLNSDVTLPSGRLPGQLQPPPPPPPSPPPPFTLATDVPAGHTPSDLAEGNYGDSSDKLFSVYLSQAEKFDKEEAESWKGDTEGILVFVRFVVEPSLAILADRFAPSLADWPFLCHGRRVHYRKLQAATSRLEQYDRFAPRPDLAATRSPLEWYFYLHPIYVAKSDFPAVGIRCPRKHIVVPQSHPELDMRTSCDAHATVGAALPPGFSALVRALQAGAYTNLLCGRHTAIWPSRCCGGPPCSSSRICFPLLRGSYRLLTQHQSQSGDLPSLGRRNARLGIFHINGASSHLPEFAISDTANDFFLDAATSDFDKRSRTDAASRQIHLRAHRLGCLEAVRAPDSPARQSFQAPRPRVFTQP